MIYLPRGQPRSVVDVASDTIIPGRKISDGRENHEMLLEHNSQTNSVINYDSSRSGLVVTVMGADIPFPGVDGTRLPAVRSPFCRPPPGRLAGVGAARRLLRPQCRPDVQRRWHGASRPGRCVPLGSRGARLASTPARRRPAPPPVHSPCRRRGARRVLSPQTPASAFVNRSGPATRFDNTRPKSTRRACRDGLQNSFTVS
jgi:hypothetical protein